MDHSGHGDSDDENACPMQMSVCLKDKKFHKKCFVIKKIYILKL